VYYFSKALSYERVGVVETNDNFPKQKKKLLGVVQTDCDGFSDAKKKVITIGVVVHTFFLLQVFISLEK